MSESDMDDRAQAVVNVYNAALDGERGLASVHSADSNFTSNARNISQDEYAAIRYARRIELTPSGEDATDPRKFTERLLKDLETMKSEFRIDQDDPDGFGIGTLHTISRKLRAYLKTLDS